MFAAAPAAAAPILARGGGAAGAPLSHAVKVIEVAKRQGIALADLFAATGVGDTLQPEAVVTAELELKYAGYFERERVQAERLRKMGALALPEHLPYEEMHSLSFESRQKLARVRPATLAQAAGIPGVSPSDLQNLVIEVERRRRMAGMAQGTGAGAGDVSGAS